MPGQDGEKGPADSSTKVNGDGSQRTEVGSSNAGSLAGIATSQPAAGVRAPMTSSPFGGQLPNVHDARSVELPAISSTRSALGSSFSPVPRSAAFSSILNPTEPEANAPSLRRKASHLDSPTSPATRLPPISSYAPPPTGYAAASPSLQLASIGDQSAPRRILTPRSPSLHRAVSLNHLSASGSAQQSPYPVSPRSRTYTVEPGFSGAPPLPTPPAAVRQAYGFTAPTPPSQAPRRASAGNVRAPRPNSESTSPRSSYSSFSQAGGHSPGPRYATASSHSSQQPYGHQQRPVGVPISSAAGQNVYQMMNIETTSGTVQLPVDVQAASRVADEKRRRNAGASARFRQRRKEKEKESSHTIARLEQELKEITEDAEFYRRERDQLRVIALQAPNSGQHFPRPESPRLRRRSSLALGQGSSASGGYAQMSDQSGHSPGEGRNVRRRTSNYSLPPPGPAGSSQASTPIVPSGPTFAHAGFLNQPYPVPSPGPHPPPPAPYAAPQPPRSQPLPPPSSSQGQGRNVLLPNLHQLMQAPPPQGAPYNPYSNDRKPHTG